MIRRALCYTLQGLAAGLFVAVACFALLACFLGQ